jgi:hypothetical protein
MVIMGTTPDAARTQGINPKQPHQKLRDARLGQDRMMLLIMINHEESQDEQTRKNAAHQFPHPVKIPNGSGATRAKEERG